MKTNSTFKFPKQFKRMMAMITDKTMRDDFRQAAISATVSMNTKPPEKEKKNGKRTAD